MNTFEQEIGEVIGVMRDAAMLDLVAIASFFSICSAIFSIEFSQGFLTLGKTELIGLGGLAVRIALGVLLGETIS